MREGRLRNTGLQNTDLEDLRHEFQYYKIDVPDCMVPAVSLEFFNFIFLFLFQFAFPLLVLVLINLTV
jgi:hypothetical protein